MRARARLLAGLVAGLLGAVGCATVQFGGGKQTIWIETRPPGAIAWVLPGDLKIQTPGSVLVERRQARTIRLELEGYCRETVYLDRVTSRSRDFPLPFGLGLGLWIDTWSGAAYTLRPDRINVYLWPANSPDRECGVASSIPRRSPLPPLESL